MDFRRWIGDGVRGDRRMIARGVKAIIERGAPYRENYRICAFLGEKDDRNFALSLRGHDPVGRHV